MAGVTFIKSGHGQNKLMRSLERILEEAHSSGELRLIGRKLKDFPNSGGKYNLSDTVFADLSKNRFVELPVEITEFYFLEKLLLYHNIIRNIPDTVVYLQCLRYLDLSRNQLSALPSAVCQLPLEVLLVANNRLTALPKEVGLTRTLMELDASCNEVALLPPQLGDLPVLRSLDLRQNLLAEIPVELMYLKLERLDISCNRIVTLPTELRGMSSLVHLELSNNPLMSPPASLCRRGRVHVFKFLEIKAMKDDKKRGFLSDELRRTHRVAGHLSDLRQANGISAEPHHKRYTVDSGYSTCDGLDKFLTQDVRPEEESRITKRVVGHARLPSDARSNGSVSGSSTPSTISPGESVSMEDELDKAMLLQSQLEKKHIKRISPDDNTTLKSQSLKSSLRPANDGLEHLRNGNGVLPCHEDSKKPLEHIQTYREYKEALRQQRSQDVYRPRQSAESSTNYEESTPIASSTPHVQNRIDASVTHVGHSAISEDSFVNSRPVQKVTPTRNCSSVTFQAAPLAQADSPLLNGSRSDGPAEPLPGDLFVKPGSPTKTSTACSGRMSGPKLVTASVGYVAPVPSACRLGSAGSRSPKLGPSRTRVAWNQDIPPEKLSFTMRREFDKAREEAELIDQLRSIIETRLKMSLPDDMAPALSDGVVLCHLANHVRPRSVASIHVPSPAVPKLTMARCRRNVDNFLEACRKIGVEEGLICCASDVLEGRGLVQVAITVVELLRFFQPRSPGHMVA
ncbi:leucine-rich repeat and calponin homology domain-containing protein isoform X2 [Bacillus rossius redtenbacheri]|uniref:leucine-rich repeat and calponin homology domain-containing protein isoform X2 n=2 Tax=Bacillus rossius redtenbacheri TaxID=93214 RepID=UPI002FDE260B